MLKNRIIFVYLIFALAAPIAVQGEIFSEPLTPIQEESVQPVPVDTVEVEELPQEASRKFWRKCNSAASRRRSSA